MLRSPHIEPHTYMRAYIHTCMHTCKPTLLSRMLGRLDYGVGWLSETLRSFNREGAFGCSAIACLLVLSTVQAAFINMGFEAAFDELVKCDGFTMLAKVGREEDGVLVHHGKLSFIRALVWGAAHRHACEQAHASSAAQNPSLLTRCCCICVDIVSRRTLELLIFRAGCYFGDKLSIHTVARGFPSWSLRALFGWYQLQVCFKCVSTCSASLCLLTLSVASLPQGELSRQQVLPHLLHESTGDVMREFGGALVFIVRDYDSVEIVRPFSNRDELVDIIYELYNGSPAGIAQELQLSSTLAWMCRVQVGMHV